MNDYDFSQINDKRFEMLVCDLLSEYFHKRVERFKPGKDSGIDGRFFSNGRGQTIIQCKHYQGSSYSNLLSKLKSEEFAKVIKLNPERYIIATSLPLSPANKEEILQAFSPYIKREDDVFGKEDLNDLLSKNNRVKDKYMELWIGNSDTLKRMLNNAIEGRSADKIERMIKSAKSYVKTENHKKALKLLRKKRIVIITGEPGIGKTTLAKNLCLNFISENYKFYDIEENLSEAEEVFVKGEKQIFYFDDFLGANYFEAIENKKDSHVMNFIERVFLDKKKIFILTSRTNILNIGIEFSSQLKDNNVRKNEFILTINDMKVMEKAKILYNHLWFSNLKKEYIDQIYKERRYMHIIKHKNFNPRLIEFITDTGRLDHIKPADYFDYIKARMDNPSDIWEQCFNTQSNGYTRNLVCLVVFNGGKISESDLEDSFNRLNKLEHLANPSHTEKSFQSTSRLAANFFLNRGASGDEMIYSLSDPSLGDYVIREYKNCPEKLSNIFSSLGSVKSLEQLAAMEFEDVIVSKVFNKVKTGVFHNVVDTNKDFDYLIYLFDRIKDDKEVTLKMLRRIIKEPKPIKEISRLISLLNKYEEDLEFNDYSFLVNCISEESLSEDEIKDIAEFLEYFEVKNEQLSLLLQSKLETFLIDELYYEKDNIDLSQNVKITQGDGSGEIEYDQDAIEEELAAMAEQIISNFNSGIINNFSYTACKKAINEIDIHIMVDNYVSSMGEDHRQVHEDDSFNYKQDNSDDAIHDLFERT